MEFQAFLFAAGRGSRLRDLTSDVIRPLLPVGNKPLIWYPLNTLEKAGFKSVTICVLASTVASVADALKEYDLGLDVAYYQIQDDDDWGTANTLREVSKNVSNDVLILSCDIITDLQLEVLADVHRRHNALVTMCFYPPPPKSDLKPPGGSKETDFDFVVLDHNTNEVVFMCSEADVESEISLSKSLLSRHPLVNVYTKLIDSHIYIMKKEAFSLMAAKYADFTSLRSELIPKLVELYQTYQEKPMNEAKNAAFEISHQEEYNNDSLQGDSVIKNACHAIIVNNNYCVRVNTMSSYYSSNMEILGKLNSITSGGDFMPIHASAIISSKAHISNDSFIGLSTKVDDKVSVKHSVIGTHCMIGERANILNSVVLTNVKIGSGCTINGSIIGVNTEIGERVELKSCVVGPGQHLLPGTKYTNEVLIDPEKMLAV